MARYMVQVFRGKSGPHVKDVMVTANSAEDAKKQARRQFSSAAGLHFWVGEPHGDAASKLDAACSMMDSLSRRMDVAERYDAVGRVNGRADADPYAELSRAKSAYEAHRKKTSEGSVDYWAARGGNAEGQRLLNEVTRWERKVREHERATGLDADEREWEVEIQIGQDHNKWKVVYIKAKSPEEAERKAKAQATSDQRRWANFYANGR